MHVLFALLIVLLFSALPAQPYSASGRTRYAPKPEEGKPMDPPEAQLGHHKFAVTPAGSSGPELGDNSLTHAHEPKMNPPKEIFEAEDEGWEWARSQFNAKWEAACRHGQEPQDCNFKPRRTGEAAYSTMNPYPPSVCLTLPQQR